MIRSRIQLENLPNELINEVLNLENFKNIMNLKLSELNDHFNDFEAKYEMVNTNFSISRRCNEFLLQHITQLECNNLNSAQYNRTGQPASLSQQEKEGPSYHQI